MSKFVQDLVTQSILEYDAMTDAESIMGIPAITTEREHLVAASLALLSNLTRSQHLMDIGDTVFSNKLDRYVSIIEGLGFEKGYEAEWEHWERQDYDADEPTKLVTEGYFIYGHSELGIVLDFDTSGGDHVSSAHIHYAWKPPIRDMSRKVRDKFSFLHKGGGWESATCPDWRRYEHDGIIPADLFWFGNQDAREALSFHIRRLTERGRFMSQWPAGEACRGVTFTNLADYTEEVEAMNPMARIAYLRFKSRRRIDESAPFLQHIINGNV
jgi:hypothetical protein